MWDMPKDKNRLGMYAKNTKKVAAYELAIGIIAIVYPILIGQLTLVFLSLLFLASGLVLGYFTYITQSKDPKVIRKSVLLILLAFLLNLSIFIGVLSLAILLGIYFFGEAIINTQISKHIEHKAAKYWLLSAFVALVLGVYVLLFLPHTMIIYLGAFIGITFIFDALAFYKTAQTFDILG